MPGDGDLDLLRRRVLNVLGHELRTPVTTLHGLATELQRGPDEATRASLVEALVRLSGRLDTLVEDLLLASEISTVVPVGDRVAVDLAALAGEHDVDVEGSAEALARPESVRRILGELLTNASVHGEPPVTVTASVAGGVAVLEVASGGPDLPAGDVANATEAFYRGERAVTTSAGLGLGLALARTLARADDGDVTVRAGDGGGLVARLELPAA